MEKLNKMIDKVKSNPKIIVIAGLVGILLIFLSGITGGTDGETKTVVAEAQKAQNYASQLEEKLTEQISQVVSGKVQVMITLETGVEYVYASESKNDESLVEDKNTGDNHKSSTDKKSESNYILYKDENGNEVPLVVTEIMPSVKGVVVGCENGENEVISSAVKTLVTTALNISDSRVCVVGLDLG